MEDIILYLHGKGGSAQEAEQYREVFPQSRVVGFAYAAQSPWEAKTEFPRYLDSLCQKGETVAVIANSIGAFFAMHGLPQKKIRRAYFISPVADMEKLILDSMTLARVTEAELQERGEIPVPFGEALSWRYLCYVREHPVGWEVPTHILYGEKDALTSLETVTAFAERIGASLTVMAGGEHWFHTPEQLRFAADWLRKVSR